MAEKNGIIRKVPFFIWLLAAIIIALLYFRMIYCYDNKYTRPTHHSSMGITTVDMAHYQTEPFFYLIDDWEYYDGKLLSPGEISRHTPDEYLFIGKYAGFDRGNPDKSPYGSATYRMTVFTDGILRQYALELPEIYSEWKIYINGESAAGHLNWPGREFLVFSARDRIEIIVNVSDDSHLYSGFTSPPAFGSPDRVGRILNQRLLYHCAGVIFALLLAALCLLIGFGSHYARPFRKFLLLCLFIAGSTSYPMLHSLQLNWDGWGIMERFCYYGSFLMIILLHAGICRLPRKITFPAIGASVLILASVVIQPFVTIERAAQYYLYSDILAVYKWLTALWLVGTSLAAAAKQISGSRYLMITSVLFPCALITDQLYPLFEPIRSGWPVETAGFVSLLTIGLILCRNTIAIYQKGVALETALELADLKEKALHETNLLKSQFLSNVSHELKLPLTVISGYAQLSDAELKDSASLAAEDGLSASDVDTDELRDYMHRIIREADRMEQMVLQLLDITKIESDRFSLEIEPVSVEELIRQVADIHFSILNDQHNNLVLDIQQNMPPILCDGTRISQVLLNLLSNSCRHTSEGLITVHAAVNDDRMMITVADTGEGIPGELIPGLFMRYPHKDENQTGRAAGTGLGLYICKIITDAHHGSISVSSTPGRGTTFCVSLPIDPAIVKEMVHQYEE